MDLGDELQKWEIVAKEMIKDCEHYSNTSVYIFTSLSIPGWISYLGTRTHCYDTDYTYDHRIPLHVAQHLLKTFRNVYDFCDNTKKALLQIASESK